MIPQLVTIRYQGKPGKRHRYWIPLLPFYLVLAPFLPFILIGLVIACARYRISPFRVIVNFTRLLASLGGFRVDLTQGNTVVFVKLT